MNKDFVLAMKPWLEKLGLEISAPQQHQFSLLGCAMLEDPIYPSVSKIFSVEEIALKHFLDSIAPIIFSPPAFKNSSSVVDLGTGGGFPLLPLAIMFPDKKFLGVDSRQKSVDFVARMAEKTGLKNVSILHSRIEELGQNPVYREKSDLVICRALSALRTLLEYTLPLTKTGGYSFYYKGPRLEEELALAAGALKIFGVTDQDLKFFALEGEQMPFSRGYLQVFKRKPVSGKFPRKNGLPTTKPL